MIGSRIFPKNFWIYFHNISLNINENKIKIKRKFLFQKFYNTANQKNSVINSYNEEISMLVHLQCVQINKGIKRQIENLKKKTLFLTKSVLNTNCTVF